MTEYLHDDNQFERDSIEMAFSVSGARNFDLIVDKPAERICEFLGHQVARKPEDLLAHVQRIRVAARHQLSPFLYGALLDLFIVLGSRGYELRKHMLEFVSDKLETGAKSHLDSVLENGIRSSDAIENPGVSVLSKGITGRVDFVDEVSTASQQGYEDPLEQALSCLESSQLDVARQVLEDAIFAGVSNTEQQQLLLDLYRKADDKLNFSVLYSSLDETSNAAPEAWEELAKHFGIDKE